MLYILPSSRVGRADCIRALELIALEHCRATLAWTLGAKTANYELAYVKKQFVKVGNTNIIIHTFPQRGSGARFLNT